MSSLISKENKHDHIAHAHVRQVHVLQLMEFCFIFNISYPNLFAKIPYHNHQVDHQSSPFHLNQDSYEYNKNYNKCEFTINITLVNKIINSYE